MKRPHLLTLLIVGVALLALTMAPVHFGNSTSVPAAASARRIHQPNQALFFEQNIGQMDRSVEFIAHRAQYDLLLSGSGMVFKPKEGHGGAGQQPVDDGTVALSFGGSSGAAKAEGDERQPTVMNYYVGTDRSRWQSGVPTFARVHYHNVYPGVDLVFYAENDKLEFDFQVAPGSNPGQIRLRTAGAYALSEDGDLVLDTQSRIRIRKPRAYQMFDGHESEVAANYVVEDGEAGVKIGEYDRTRALTIDPVVLYGGYVPVTGQGDLGGPTTVAADAAGNAYLLSALGKGCVVTKFSSTGALVYQTTYGSAAVFVWCYGIAADTQGNTYISGATEGGIPTTPGVVQPNYAGNIDAFTAKLTNTGQLAYGTYVGGSGADWGYGIAVDTNGNAYLTGSTSSNDFPLANPFQSSLTGQGDAFVTALNPTASAFVYSTYLGGSASTSGSGIAVDGTGEAYVAGSTNSPDFPVKNTLYSCGNPCGAPFLTKFDSSGSALVYSTYLNPNAYVINGPTVAIAVDQNGSAFVAAGSMNQQPSFWDVSASGTLNFSGVFSISGLFVSGYSLGVGVDAAGNLYIGAGSVNVPFDTTPDAVGSYTNSGTLIYAIQIYSLGIYGVAGAEAGNVYVSGVPQYDAGQPFFQVNNAQPDTGAILSKISAENAPALGYSPPTIAFGFQPVGVTSPPQTLNLQDAGSATLDLNNIVVTGPGFAPDPGNSTCTTTLAAWAICTYSVTFTPVNGNPATGAITITDNSLGSPHVIQLTGQGGVPAVTLNPTSLPFSDTIVGQNSSAMAVTMTNTGHATLTISRISISGDFSETNNCGSSLSAGQNCSISVIFTPTALGARSGAVTIADNASNSPQMVPLSGTGVSALPAVTLNPPSLSFPDTVVGQSSSAMVVTMTNTGHATLSISRISISGDFSESNTCGASLNAGQNCSISVIFTPAALGAQSGAVTIGDNASNSPQMIPLSGTGISGSLNLGPAPGGSTSATVQAGQPAGYKLSIGGAGFSGTASLSCTGAPTGAACSVPSGMNINASTATPFNVSVTTTSRTISMLHPGNMRSRWLWATSLFCLVILPIGRGKKQLVFIGRSLPILLLLLICSCGGGSGSSSGSTTNPNGTPAGTYQLTVAAKSGSVSQSIMLTLKVE
jgi:hypothetical protein